MKTIFKVKKTMEISASHCLNLSYESKCNNQHGHNWLITVFCKSEELNENDMVIDFSEIKKLIHDKLDHQNLNDVLGFRPTAENIARWVVERIPFCYKAIVVESNNNEASYEIIQD